MTERNLNEDQEFSLKLFVVLSKVSKGLMEAAIKDIKQHGLSASEFAILELLYHKDRVPLQQIGNSILVTSGSITYNIDKLENKQYLRREPCSEDRRVIYAVLTDKGRKLMDDIFPQHAQAIQDEMQSLSLEEKKSAITLLKKLGLGGLQAE